MHIRFEWDPGKARSNKRKHGVSFEEAATVFYDENGIFIADPDVSGGEERFLLIGMSSKPEELVVCHCNREVGSDSVIRIINARRATKNEKAQYWERLK